MHRQIDLAKAGLERLQIPTHLYEHLFNVMRNGFSTSVLGQSIQNVRSQLPPEVRLMLQWSAYMLEDEGGVVDPQELAALIAATRSLLRDVSTSALPSTLRDFLLSHLQELLAGLEGRAVAGAEPLQKAVKTLAADIVANEAELKATDDLPEEQKKGLLARAGQIFSKSAEMAATAGKGAEGISKVWKAATETVPQIGHWIKAGLNLLSGPDQSP